MGTYHTHTAQHTALLGSCLIHHTTCAFHVTVLALTTLLYSVKYFIGMIKCSELSFISDCHKLSHNLRQFCE